MRVNDQSLPPDLRVERLEGDVAVVSGSVVSGIRRTVLRTTGREAVALGQELIRAGRDRLDLERRAA